METVGNAIDSVTDNVLQPAVDAAPELATRYALGQGIGAGFGASGGALAGGDLNAFDYPSLTPGEAAQYGGPTSGYVGDAGASALSSAGSASGSGGGAPAGEAGTGLSAAGDTMAKLSGAAPDFGITNPDTVGLGAASSNGFSVPADASASFGPSGGGASVGLPDFSNTGGGWDAPASDEMFKKVSEAVSNAGGSSSGSLTQKAFDLISNNKLATAGLGMNLASQISQRNAAKSIPGQFRAAAAPLTDTATSLLDQYKSGQINAGTKFDIDRWKNEQIAKSNNFYSRAGQADSSAAKNARARIEAEAASMADKARQGLLSQGLNAAGIAQGPLQNAITAQAQQDQSFMQSQSQALQSLMLMQAMQSKQPAVG